jgi:hypothetical protein
MAMTIGNRDLEKEKYWSEIIERQKRSGKSQAQFCKDENLNANKFYYWSGVLAKRQKGKNRTTPVKPPATLPFVPLRVLDNFEISNKSDALEQMEISKIVVRIPASTDRATIACIFQSLEKP